jgi:dTDP-4-dehydrorhamnose reductase
VSLLVVGASGYLGGEICRLAVEAGEWVVGTYAREPGAAAGVTWAPLDIRDAAAVREVVARVRPCAVVNAASGYADWAVTAVGAAHVAVAAASVQARLIHVSSDAVHAGRSTSYVDDELPSPVFHYGAAKAAAETAVSAVDPGAALVRTAASGRATLFSDEVRCPVAVDDLAAALLELAAGDRAGLLNVAGPEAVSRVELGRLVARRRGLDPDAIGVGTIASSGQVRPARVVLDVARAQAVLETRLRPVSEVYTV